jgi:hypothetical protein
MRQRCCKSCCSKKQGRKKRANKDVELLDGDDDFDDDDDSTVHVEDVASRSTSEPCGVSVLEVLEVTLKPFPSGLGVQFDQTDSGLLITSVSDKSSLSMLKAGDVITEMDGVPTQSSTKATAVKVKQRLMSVLEDAPEIDAEGNRSLTLSVIKSAEAQSPTSQTPSIGKTDNTANAARPIHAAKPDKTRETIKMVASPSPAKQQPVALPPSAKQQPVASLLPRDDVVSDKMHTSAAAPVASLPPDTVQPQSQMFFDSEEEAAKKAEISRVRLAQMAVQTSGAPALDLSDDDSDDTNSSDEW